MRSREFITELAVGTIFTEDLVIVVDDHALDRAKEREVDPRAVDYVIKRRLPRVLSKLKRIELGQRFWVYDWSREIALGFRRISSSELKFVLKTVWPGAPAMTPGIEAIINT
jgi:hypothetical protein